MGDHIWVPRFSVTSPMGWARRGVRRSSYSLRSLRQVFGGAAQDLTSSARCFEGQMIRRKLARALAGSAVRSRMHLSWATSRRICRAAYGPSFVGGWCGRYGRGDRDPVNGYVWRLGRRVKLLSRDSRT